MYKLNYNPEGKVSTIIKISTGENIPLCEDNADCQDFLKWNAKQKTPLDLESIIEPIKPEPPRDLVKEIDAIKAQVITINTKLAIK